MNLVIKPVKVSEETMDLLDLKGVIRRIIPNKDVLKAKFDESKHLSIYESKAHYGLHKLVE